MPAATLVRPHVRWMRRLDFGAVLRLDELCFEPPHRLRFEDVERLATGQSSVGRVAVLGGEVAGYSFAAFRPGLVHLLAVAVHPADRGLGVGRALVAAALARTATRPRVTAWVRESALGPQLFLRALGFRCVRTLPGLYAAPGGAEDGYAFEWRRGRA